MVSQLVLVRHGQSLYNDQNRFTGWTDVPLTAEGYKETVQAGKLLKSHGFAFDRAYTSVLKRCIISLHAVLEEADQLWIPEEKCWRLNERHYGGLQGQSKSAVAEKVGEQQAQDWRRSYACQPPVKDDAELPAYVGDGPGHVMQEAQMPLTESLQDTVKRILPLWHDSIAPAVRSGQRVLIVAHGNSIRALVKHLQGISDDDIPSLHVPIGIPVVYELDDDLNAVGNYHVEEDQAH